MVQTQDNVRHHALRYAERIGLGAGDRVTLLSTYGFDAAVMDIFGSLLSGATLCLWDVLSGDFFDLGRWLARRRITVYHSTPTLFRRLVAVLPDAERPGDGPADVRWVVLGGEVVESADAQNFRRAFPPGCRMINGLGPTESTLALQEVVDHQTDLPRATLPVGRPVPGTTVRLLHVGGEQSAVYGVGEIVLAGRRLATGYWRRPALTAEAFVPDPAVPGGRAYRTGDLGRLLPHGKIEFVGRRDQQMKIRGYRVEPGEVEAVLLAERGVREAVVCRLVNERGRDRLGAFWVAEEGVELDQRRLAGRMAAVLPGYMVPSFWLELPEMPLTTSGKVDRRALTELAEEAGDGAEIGGLALASQEAILALAASWKRLLGRPPGPEDDFLRSGGDSLTAIELAGELRGRGWLLAPRQILENPLLSQMISHIEPLRHEAAVDRDEPEGGGPVPFAPLQRYFFGQPQVPERWTVVCAHEAIKGVRSHLLAQAVRELANHHEALALRFTPAACGWSQSAGRPPGEGAVGAGFGVLDLGALPEADRERATRQAAARLQRGFDLASGPLLRVCLVRAEGRPPRLLMVAHHVVADELSLSILREDLEVLYGGLMATGKADLRAKSSGFATWARRAHELSDSGRLEPFRHAWTALPWGRSACLPEARSNGANRRGSVEWVSRDLGEGETAVLLKASSERGVGVDEILLAALARALVSWSGREWWVVHRLWHGRDPAGVLGVDLARTVGCLSALVPILLRLPEASSFDDALLVVRTASDVPPGATARAALLQYSTDSVGDATGPVPPPQIVLNYFGRRSEPTPDGPLRLRPVEQDWGARHPPNAERPYLLGLFAEIAGGSLWLRFDYSAEIHQRATIERLARGLEEDLLDWGARTEAEDRQRSSVASLREGDVV